MRKPLNLTSAAPDAENKAGRPGGARREAPIKRDLRRRLRSYPVVIIHSAKDGTLNDKHGKT